MSDKKRSLARPLTLAAFTLLILGGMIVGVMVVYKKGLDREGLYDKADRLYREQDFDGAARFAREALVAEPSHMPARQLLLEALIQAGRLDDARTAGEEFLRDGPGNEFAVRVLTRVALSRNDVDEARRLVRSLADTQPDYALNILARLEDSDALGRDQVAGRLQAAHLVRRLATVTESPETRAHALVFATGINHEIAQAGGSDAFRASIQRDLKDASVAADEARQHSQIFPHELMIGLIRVYSERPEEAEVGARMLRRFVGGVEHRDSAAAALARYHVAREEPAEAKDLLREIKDRYYWMRVFWVLRKVRATDLALAALESSPLGEDALARKLLRAELLLESGDAARKEKGLALLRPVLLDKETDIAVCLRVLFAVARRTDVATARQLAEETQVTERGDRRITALLAALLTASDDPEGLEMVEQLAESELDDPSAVVPLMGGGAARARYIDRKVEEGGSDVLELRLERALNLLKEAHAQKSGDEKLRQRIVTDLTELSTAEESSKVVLWRSFLIATTVREPELAGRLLARTIAAEGVPQELTTRALEMMLRPTNADAARSLVPGMREVASQTAAPAFVNAFAEVMASKERDPAAITDAFLRAADADAGSRTLALELACRLQLGRGEAQDAEATARSYRELHPDTALGRELLGAALISRRDYDAVVALQPPAADRSPRGTFQMIAALSRLGRNDEALAEAKDAVGRFPDSVEAYAVLARQYVDQKEPRKALSVLSIAPANPFLIHMSNELLVQQKEYEMARAGYEQLLLRSDFRDHLAWKMLFLTVNRTKQQNSFVVLATSVLDRGVLDGARGVRALVRFLRGQALEVEGRLQQALTDYEAAIADDPKAWEALNNAAWHIATISPTRIETAREYTDRALALEPEHPDVLDTAAEVYFRAGDAEKGFAFLNRAIALESARTPRYLLHKAGLLQESKRPEEYRRILTLLCEQHADTPEAVKAQEAIASIELAERRAREEQERLEEEKQAREAAAANG